MKKNVCEKTCKMRRIFKKNQSPIRAVQAKFVTAATSGGLWLVLVRESEKRRHKKNNMWERSETLKEIEHTARRRRGRIKGFEGGKI